MEPLKLDYVEDDLEEEKWDNEESEDEPYDFDEEEES